MSKIIVVDSCRECRSYYKESPFVFGIFFCVHEKGPATNDEWWTMDYRFRTGKIHPKCPLDNLQDAVDEYLFKGIEKEMEETK